MGKNNVDDTYIRIHSLTLGNEYSEICPPPEKVGTLLKSVRRCSMSLLETVGLKQTWWGITAGNAPFAFSHLCLLFLCISPNTQGILNCNKPQPLPKLFSGKLHSDAYWDPKQIAIKEG